MRVSCRTTVSGDRLSITVADTGPGIPGEKLGRLFSPFERLGAEHSGIEGSGLGLALSKRLIEAQGGNIEVASTVGVGSAFTVTLPLAVASVLPNIFLQGGRETWEAGSPAPDDILDTGRFVMPYTVLYIEDNPSNLSLVESLLSRQPGIEMIAAIRGDIGLEMATRLHPDLILLDLHLPDLSGEEVLRRLQGDAATRGVPVVMISADAIPAQIDALIAAGARAYMTKPLDVKSFLQIVHGCLHTEQSRAAGSGT